MRKYSHTLRAVRETPWAILPQKLAVICELLAYRAEGFVLSEEEVRARVGAGPASRSGYTAGSVAVLPLYGVLVPRAGLFTEYSGGTSLTTWGGVFRQAVNDPEVGAILIDVNSPGGMTDLVPELAAEIRAARGSKPIVAIANTDAASAAYWLAAQADELVVTPSGMVGSIGVFSAHEDLSGFQERMGVKTTLVSAGRYKTEGNPYEPLSEEARAAIQKVVDEFYGMFVADVAAGRGVASARVAGGFGEGRMVTAAEAFREGMVDRVDTFQATLERLLSGKQGRKTVSYAGTGVVTATGAPASYGRTVQVRIESASKTDVTRLETSVDEPGDEAAARFGVERRRLDLLELS